MKEIKVKLTFTEPVLGTCPGDPDIYRAFVARNSPDAATMEDEVAAIGVDGVVEKGKTVFPKLDDGTPFFYDYQIKGFFKDTCGGLRKVKGTVSSGIKAFKKEIDKLIFVEPRNIPILFDGEMGECSRPLRAQTMQGERVGLALSEQIPAGATCEFMSQLMGLPVSAAMREAKVMWNNSVGAVYPAMKLKTYKGKDENNIRYAYQDGYIDEERAVALLQDKAGYSEGDARLEVMKWESGASGKYTVYLEAVENGENVGEITKKYLSYGVEPKQLSSEITSYFKPIYVTLGPADRATLKGYLLNAYVRLGYDRDKKSKDIDKWMEGN